MCPTQGNQEEIVKDWFFNVLLVICISKKIRFALALGIVGYFVIDLCGEHMLHDFHLSGILVPLGELFKEKLREEYNKAALGCLTSFWLLAFRLYYKEKERMYRF